MWVKAFRLYNNCGQHTNAAIESYHNRLKTDFLGEKPQLVSRRIDWLVHMLLEVVLPTYKHKWYLKRNAHVKNTRQLELTRAAIEKARAIPDICVSKPGADADGTVVVPSSCDPHTFYAVRPMVWLGCSCPVSAELVRACCQGRAYTLHTQSA